MIKRKKSKQLLTRSWMEIVITIAIIFTGVWVFRWIVSWMPVFGRPPAWAEQKH